MFSLHQLLLQENKQGHHQQLYQPEVTVKQEKEEQTPKRSKRIKEMETGPEPRKKPKVLTTYVRKKSETQEEKETSFKKMRGQIFPPQDKPQQEQGSERKKKSWKPEM